MSIEKYFIKIPEIYLSMMMFFYLLLVWLDHLVIISIVNFFHFELNHNLTVIEKWMSHNAPEIILLSKMIALLICYKYFIIYFDTVRPFKKIINHGIKYPDYIFWGIILLFYIVVSYLSPLISSEYIVIRPYFFYFLFYVVDLIFMYLLTNHLKVKNFTISNFRLMLFYILYSNMNIIFSTKTFLYVELPYAIFIFNFVVSLRLMIYKKLNWTLPIIYLFICGVPLSLLFDVEIQTLGCLAIVVYCYLYYHEKDNKKLSL